MQRELELPMCNLHFGKGMVPWFQPMVVGQKSEVRSQR
jgi:hypothetical protein